MLVMHRQGFLGIWSSDLLLLTLPPLTFGCLTQLGKLGRGHKICTYSIWIFCINLLHTVGRFSCVFVYSRDASLRRIWI